MAKRELLLEFMQIMSDETDVEHPLTAQMIAKRIKEKTNEDITRQTIYSYIDILSNFDFEIMSNSPHEGYYLAERVLEEEELEWLCHSIMANNTLPYEYSVDLLNKLSKTQSKYTRHKLENHLHIINPDKKDNKELFLSIRSISDAISQKRKITFRYTRYNTNKDIVSKNDKLYEVEPLFMVSRDNRLYLVCYYEKYKEIIHYRVDRMVDVKMIDSNTICKQLNSYEYTRHRLYMYSGELNEYLVKFDENILDDIIELFSKDIEITRNTDHTCLAKVKTTKSAIIYFAFQFIKYVEVLEPIETRQEITQLLKSSYDNYLNINEEER